MQTVMTHEQIMSWGEQWNYPQLVLSQKKNLCLRHGKQHYQELQANPERMLLAAIRINTCNERFVQQPAQKEE